MDQPGRGRFLFALLLATSGLKLFAAWRFPGFLTGDDLEVVQAAAACAGRLTYRAWSLRSLFHPVALACPFVALGAGAGLTSPRALTVLAALPTILFSTLAVPLVVALARAWGWSERTARVAGFLYAVHGLSLGYGGTPYPRPIATCLVLAAFVAVARAKPGTRSLAVLAGGLVAAAFAVRWSEAVALAALLAWSAWDRKDPRTLAAILGGFLAGVLLFVGAFDARSSGAPFGTLREFWRIMQVQGLASSRPEPWFWYGKRILHWAGPASVLLVLAARRDRRLAASLGTALAVAALLSFSPAKSVRYTQLVIPFLCLAAALGWERLRDATREGRVLATVALIVAASLGLERALTLWRDKSAAAILAAGQIHALRPPVRGVALEQMWAYGESLYLGNEVTIRDIRPARPLEPEAVRRAAAGADAVGLYASDADAAVAEALASAGLRRCATFARLASPTVVLYLPESRPCPAGGAPAAD